MFVSIVSKTIWSLYDFSAPPEMSAVATLVLGVSTALWPSEQDLHSRQCIVDDQIKIVKEWFQQTVKMLREILVRFFFSGGVIGAPTNVCYYIRVGTGGKEAKRLSIQSYELVNEDRLGT